MRLAEMHERESSEFDFDGRSLDQLSDVELMQIYAWGQDVTKTKFLQIARGETSQDSVSSEV